MVPANAADSQRFDPTQFIAGGVCVTPASNQGYCEIE
jgi:hypothetical protein